MNITILPLPVRLTDDDVLAKAAEMAQLHAEILNLEEERSAAARSFAVQLKEQRRRETAISRAIATREETRDVECELVPDYVQRKMLTIRCDTGELVSARPLTAEEGQGELFDAGDAATGVPAPPDGWLAEAFDDAVAEQAADPEAAAAANRERVAAALQSAGARAPDSIEPPLEPKRRRSDRAPEVTP